MRDYVVNECKLWVQEISIIDVKVWFQHYNHTDGINSDFGLFLFLSQIVPYVWIILVVLISVATILSYVNRNISPESKVTLAFSCFFSGIWSTALYHVGERRLSKKELKQLQELNAIAFHEDTGNNLHHQLEERDKSAYGIIKSLLSMDSNSEVYDQTASKFFFFW